MGSFILYAFEVSTSLLNFRHPTFCCVCNPLFTSRHFIHVVYPSYPPSSPSPPSIIPSNFLPKSFLQITPPPPGPQIYLIPIRPSIHPIPPLLIPPLPPHPHSLRQPIQHLNSSIPTNTRIRNGDAFFQARGPFGGDFLAAFVQVGFDHYPDDAGFAGADLGGDGVRDVGLVAVVFLGVAWVWGVVSGGGEVVKRGSIYHANSQSS